MLRTLVPGAALALGLAAAAPAAAAGLNNLGAAVNSILTFPADPVLHVYEPPEQLSDMPGFPVTGRICGLFSGTLQGAYRALAGVTDLVTFPLWVVPLMSPPPHIVIVPNVEGYRGE
jgi:hypothetical protein